MNTWQRSLVGDVLQLRKYKAGQTIVEKGASPTCFYLVMKVLPPFLPEHLSRFNTIVSYLAAYLPFFPLLLSRVKFSSLIPPSLLLLLPLPLLLP
jgi:hypothetical protein